MISLYPDIGPIDQDWKSGELKYYQEIKSRARYGPN